MFSPAKLTTYWANGDDTMRVQHVRKWSNDHDDDDCCEETGLTKLNKSQFEICLLDWNGCSVLYATLSVNNLDTAKYVHSAYRDVWWTSTKIHTLRLPFLIFTVRKGIHLPFVRFLWTRGAQSWMCVCVCVCDFLFLSLYIQTVSDLHKGYILETFM
jgi:hypothetical protein